MGPGSRRFAAVRDDRWWNADAPAHRTRRSCQVAGVWLRHLRHYWGCDMTSSHYAHGTYAADQQLLSTMNRLLNDRCLAAAQLAKVERIVDFGAGLGQFSRDMARTTGVKVLGIERSAEQIGNALALAAEDGEAHLLEMRQGEVETPPLAEREWGTFDVAHTRFLLEHLRNPVATVR